MGCCHRYTILHRALLFLSLCSIASITITTDAFDVRHHLSTVTRYDVSKEISAGDAHISIDPPNKCSVIHLNLVARHGTRAPTKKRIRELDRLAIRLNSLVSHVEVEAHGIITSPEKYPAWLSSWQSPWKGRDKGGELITLGEEELYLLGNRIRERFPELFNVEYHPDIFPIKATQVPRASASAVAFGLGLFSGKGSLGHGRHRAFSVVTESRASDIWLRFYDTCQTYKDYRITQEPAVEKLKEPILTEVSSALTSRYSLNFTMSDVASLWFLCKQATSLLDITDQACALFNQTEVLLLEWTDDLEMFILKGYGKSINYRMGLPLLRDVLQSMEKAVFARESQSTGTFEKAQLRFAHAETVVPFTCLLGLFLERSEFEKIQSEQPFQLPPKPPLERSWRGSIVAPFAGNNMLALYHCPADKSKSSAPEKHNGSYFVQVFHNEIPVKLPGCGDVDLCPFEVFKEKVVSPHLRHNFESICNVKSVTTNSCSSPCKLLRAASNIYRWIFPAEQKDEARIGGHKGEL
ncbi:uncharacterized protein LOC116263272 isoform X1 [Nymphaea colorata]|nr:uncharacterized protein LOC116263272 isoform X1 [Nymphaea colorata]